MDSLSQQPGTPKTQARVGGGASGRRENKWQRAARSQQRFSRSWELRGAWKGKKSSKKPSRLLKRFDRRIRFLCGFVTLNSLQLKAMETMQELIPFAKEMLSQKPNRKMVKMYMLGSMLAFVGVVIGLVETVCSPFTSEGKLEEDEVTEEEKKKRPVSLMKEAVVLPKQKEVILEKSKPDVALRNLVNRQHAS